MVPVDDDVSPRHPSCASAACPLFKLERSLQLKPAIIMWTSKAMSSSSEISWAGKARKVRMRDKDARPLGEDVETFRAGLAIEKGYVRTYVRKDGPGKQ